MLAVNHGSRKLVEEYVGSRKNAEKSFGLEVPEDIARALLSKRRNSIHVWKKLYLEDNLKFHRPGFLGPENTKYARCCRW